MSCRTPVVLMIFRRPDLTRQVLDAIRTVKPMTLLVIADGPRHSEEAVLCQEARAVIDQVDWPCTVLKNYSDENRGARRRISSGLDWVFDQVEKAIILEDDCLPHPSFFPYCEELLERYREDLRIGSISGDNFQDGQQRGTGSYFFTNYFHGWGWATWKRAWCHYDHEMAQWPVCRDEDQLSRVLDEPHEVNYWTEFLDVLSQQGVPDAWDYIWMWTGWMQGMLTLQPNVNLVSNIGFGAGATNTMKESVILSRPLEAIGPLTHPSTVERDQDADLYIFEHVFPGAKMRRELCWKYRLKQRLWRLKQRMVGK